MLLSCNSAIDDQRDFELEAQRPASGITQTDVAGRIQEVDEDDWRIGPLFVGLIEVFNPAFPNPTSNQVVRIDFNVNSFDAVDGLIIIKEDENGFRRTIYAHPESPLRTGIVTVQFQASILDNTGIFTNARGVHRIPIYDRLGRLITYGDIEVI